MYRRSGVLLTGVLFFVCAGSLLAEAYSIPTSTRLVHGQMALPNGEVLKFAVLEGQMLTLRDADAGSYFGFSPTIVDEAHREVGFVVFEIIERGPDQHMLRQIESVEVAATGWLGAVNAEVEIVSIEESGLTQTELAKMQAQLAVPSKLDATELSDPGEENIHPGRCCVTCGTTTACGCAVSLGCGSCCQGPCCLNGGSEDY